MQLAPIPIQSGHRARQSAARARVLVQVKFLGLPLEGEPEPVLQGSVYRFISRVIGCLVAARP